MNQAAMTKESKPQRQDKTLLLMEIALELKLYRTPEGIPMAEIPNWDDASGPMPLDSNIFKMWLSYRCFKLHGFVASSAALNAVIRTVSGIAMFDESTTLYSAPEEVTADQEPKRVARLAVVKPATPSAPTYGPGTSHTIESALSRV